MGEKVTVGVRLADTVIPQSLPVTVSHPDHAAEVLAFGVARRVVEAFET